MRQLLHTHCMPDILMAQQMLSVFTIKKTSTLNLIITITEDSK